MRAIVLLTLFIAANAGVASWLVRPGDLPAPGAGPRSFASPAKFQDRVPLTGEPTFEERWAPVWQVVARRASFEQIWTPTLRRAREAVAAREAMVVPQVEEDAPAGSSEPVRAIPVRTIRVTAASAAGAETATVRTTAVVRTADASAPMLTGRPEKAACQRVGRRTVWRGRWSWNCRR